MLTKNRIVNLIVCAVLLLNIKASFAQLSSLDFSEARIDTISVALLSGFEYDVMIIDFDGIEVYNGILFSYKETGDTHDGFKVYYNERIEREIRIDVFLFERNQKSSPEYNALWYKWNENDDIGYYYNYVKVTKYYTKAKDGKIIGISLKYDESGRKYPFLEFSKVPFLLN